MAHGYPATKQVGVPAGRWASWRTGEVDAGVVGVGVVGAGEVGWSGNDWCSLSRVVGVGVVGTSVVVVTKAARSILASI